MKGFKIYYLLPLALLFTSCERDDSAMDNSTEDGRRVTLSLAPVVRSSISQGEIVSRAEDTYTDLGKSGNNCRLAIYSDRETAKAYPSEKYEKIFAFWSASNMWKYGFGSTDNADTKISLQVDGSCNTLHLSGLCASYSNSTQYAYVQSSNLTRFYLQSFTSTCYYNAYQDITLEDGKSEYQETIKFDPLYAKLVINLKMENEQEDGVDLYLIDLVNYNANGSAINNLIPYKAWYNCATNTVNVVEKIAIGPIAGFSTYNKPIITDLGTTARTITRYILPYDLNGNTAKLRFGFRLSSIFDNYFEFPESFTGFEVGKEYIVDITLDNYGHFTNVTFDTQWQKESEDIGSII